MKIEGATAVVLKDGLSGMEFYYQHVGTEVVLFGHPPLCYPRKIYESDKSILEVGTWLWHYVLIGDVKGWHGITSKLCLGS